MEGVLLSNSERGYDMNTIFAPSILSSVTSETDSPPHLCYAFWLHHLLNPYSTKGARQDSYPKAYPILCSLTPLAVSWSCFDPVFFFWLNVPYLDSVEKLLCSDPLPRPAWSPSPLLIQLTRLNEGLGISRLILTSETQESIGTSSRLLRTA